MTKDVRVIRPTAEGSDAHKTRVAAYCRVSTVLQTKLIRSLHR